MILKIKEKINVTIDFTYQYYWPFLIICTPFIIIYRALLIILIRNYGALNSAGYSLLVLILNFIFDGFFLLLVIFLINTIHHKQKFSLKDINKFITDNFFTVALSIFLINLVTRIGLYLLILPGIYILVRLSLTPFLISLDNINLMRAFHLSFQLSKQNTWVMFFSILIVSIPAILFGIILQFTSNIVFSFLLNLILYGFYIVETILIYHFYLELKGYIGAVKTQVVGE